MRAEKHAYDPEATMALDDLWNRLGLYICCRLIGRYRQGSELYRTTFDNGYLFQRGPVTVAATYNGRTYLSPGFARSRLPKAFIEDFACVDSMPFGRLTCSPEAVDIPALGTV